MRHVDGNWSRYRVERRHGFGQVSFGILHEEGYREGYGTGQRASMHRWHTPRQNSGCRGRTQNRRAEHSLSGHNTLGIDLSECVMGEKTAIVQQLVDGWGVPFDHIFYFDVNPPEDPPAFWIWLDGCGLFVSHPRDPEVARECLEFVKNHGSRGVKSLDELFEIFEQNNWPATVKIPIGQQPRHTNDEASS